MKRAVFYTYSPPIHTEREVCLYRQIRQSFSSLRETNSKIEVCLFSFDRENPILDKICRQYSVFLRQMGQVENLFQNYDKRIREIWGKYSYSHKWISLALSREMDVDSILLVDADTWFFKDPEDIFERYEEEAIGTPFLRKSASEMRKSNIRDLCRQCEDFFNVPHVETNLIRSSVLLMNKEGLGKYCDHFDYFHETLWKLISFIKNLRENGDYSQNNCRNVDKIIHMGFYHIEELAAAVYLSYLKIKMNYLDISDVWQGSDFFLNGPGKNLLPVMVHYTNRHTRFFFDWKKSKHYLFK